MPQTVRKICLFLLLSVCAFGQTNVNNGGSGGGGGGGTVTSFSAGTLSPLFTTSVATPTSTPALTFSLSNATANTLFGNATGSTGAPSYFAPAGDISLSVGSFTVKALNGTVLSGLGTGILKNTTGTGVPSIAVASDIVSLIQGLTGCNTASNVFTPQASDCVAQTSGFSNPMTTLGDIIYENATPAATRLAGPTAPNSVPQFLTNTPSGGAAAAEAWLLAGVPIDATNPATLLTTDRANFLNWTTGTALALPSIASTGFGNNLPFVLRNTEGATLTVTPNAGHSDLCDGSATCTILNNFAAFVYQDAGTNWERVYFPTFAAFGSTCTGVLQFSTTTGFSCNNSPTLSGTLTVSTQLTLGASGTLTPLVMGNATSGTVTLEPVTGALGSTTDLLPVAVNSPATLVQTIASGTAAMGTGAITSGTCASVVTVAATNAATTDTIIATPNADPTGVTGYAVSASGSLYIQSYPTAGNVNFKVCNNTGGSLTPSALTLNWRVIR